MKLPLRAAMEAYGHSLYTAAFNICRNVQDAEDAVQDTFLQYWTHKKDFASEQHMRAWLLRVAINKAKNRRNSFFRRSTLPLEDYMETLTFETEASGELFAEVMKLPEKYRIVIHLFYYEDFSVKEIADILKLTPGNAKMRLSRGRALLRDALKEAWEDDES